MDNPVRPGRMHGLLGSAIVLDSIGYIGNGDPIFFQASFLLIGAGIICGIFSIPAHRQRRFPQSHRLALVGNVAAGLLVVLSWILRLRFPGTPSDTALATFGAGIVLILFMRSVDGKLIQWVHAVPLPALIVLVVLVLSFGSYAFSTSAFLNRPAHDDSLVTLRGHRGIVLSVALSGDGRQIASGGFDQTVRLWDAKTGAELKVLRGHTDRVMAVAFSPDGLWLISGSKDSTARVWEVATGRVVHVITGHSDRVTSLAFTSDGSRLATGSRDRTIKIWDAGSWREIRTFIGHTGFVWSVAFSPDGHTLVSGGWDGTVRLWDVTGSEKTREIDANGRVRSVALTSDGRWLESSDDEGASIWNMGTGTQPRIVRTYPSEVVFALRGENVYSAHADRTIRIHNMKKKTSLRTFSGHADHINALAVSNDGTVLVSASSDATIKVWQIYP